MNIPMIAAIVVFIIMGIIANIFLFKFTTMQFIGIMLVAFIVLYLVIHFLMKANKKRKGIEGEPDAFIFPDKTAKKMKKIDLGVQYEASVISSSLLMLGIILFLIYMIFFTESSWVMKGLIIFNSLCGLGLMGGMVITYYQQLVAYRESTKFLRQAAMQQQTEGSNMVSAEDLYAQNPEYYDDNFDERRIR